MRTEKGTPKSDFNYTYQGNDVFFISHKAYGKRIAFQQYGGMPEAIKFNPNSSDIKSFVKAAQKYYSQFGNKFKDVQTMDKMNRDLDLFSEVVEKLSSEYSTELLDLRKIFMDYISTNNPNNNSSGILTYDGVHLNKQGNTLIANEMLKFFN